MTITHFFAVYDSKVKLYAQPFQMRTVAEAIRGFESVANDSSTDICKYAEDYFLFHLGSFDSETGQFTNNNAPHNLGVASSYKKFSLINPASAFPSQQGANN